VPRSKNAWSYTSTPPIPLHGVVLRKKAQRQLYLYLLIAIPMLLNGSDILDINERRNTNVDGRNSFSQSGRRINSTDNKQWRCYRRIGNN
jgi:hypothetical protein